MTDVFIIQFLWTLDLFLVGSLRVKKHFRLGICFSLVTFFALWYRIVTYRLDQIKFRNKTLQCIHETLIIQCGLNLTYSPGSWCCTPDSLPSSNLHFPNIHGERNKLAWEETVLWAEITHSSLERSQTE